MRKSLVMLVLLTLTVAPLLAMVPLTDGVADIKESNGAGSIDQSSEITCTVLPTNDPKVVRPSPSPAVEDDLLQISPISYYQGVTGEPWPQGYGSDPTRGASNTSTLIYIQKAPKSVHYMDKLVLEALLLEDNNSDGERSSGDTGIAKEYIDFLWADGTEWMLDLDLMTEWDSQELNMTLGRFSMPSAFLWNVDENGNKTNQIEWIANISNIAANPVELVLTYKGVWTTDGSRFYNLTQDIYNTIYDTAIGKDDDNDANTKQHNNIDDDGDGVIDDGRPGIDAFGTPEPTNLNNNGIDDDSDGWIDDGYPGITKVNSPEGVDEELLNGRDDDNDGYIDEDPFAFIARRGTEKRLYVEIWHKTKTTVEVEGSDLIDVGQTFTVSGTIADASYEETNMGAKTLRLFWDGQPVAETVAKPSSSGYFSEYKFTYRVSLDAQAGPHNVMVEFSPAYNQTNNYFFDPSNATTTIHVRRPTMVVFDNIDPNYGVSWVYRGTTIYINGSIIDKLYYERNFVKEGPKLNILGVDYGNEYRYNVMWGDVIQPFVKIWHGQFLIDDNGTFSIEYELPASSQPLGPVTVTVDTNFDQNRYHEPIMYYSNSKNSTTFSVRATTELLLWIDQNKNGINDENELDDNGQPLETFITRKSFVDQNGKQVDWNYARVRGVLKDMSQSSGAIVVGVPTQELTLTWGFGTKFVKPPIPLVTDANGRFSVDIPIDPKHALGVVPIRVSYESDFFTDYYDRATYYDNDGQPFSVVSFTSLSVNASVAIKGKPVQISGTLSDDILVGIGNKTVKLYRLDRWDGNYNSLKTAGGLGIYIGSTVTNSIGKYTFNEYVVEERMNVGSVWVVAKYDGSVEFPEELGGSIRYLSNDAFMPNIATPSKMIITSETAVVLDNVPEILVRNGEARLTGKLLESYKGRQVNRGVAGQTVTAYIKQGENLYKMNSDRTKNDPNLPEFNGYFEIKTQNVPSDLLVGKVEVLVEFVPETGTEGIPLYQPSYNITVAEVWSSTRIKDVFIGPSDDDTPPDRRLDLYSDRTDNLVFTFQVLEGATVETGGEPVTNGEVWLNITMGSYKNSTLQATDIRGRVHFNFTGVFQDTATGNKFTLPVDTDSANMTIEVKFKGKHFFQESSKIYPCTYHRTVLPPDPTPPYLWIILGILVLLAVAGIGLYFFAKYIEKKRRLKALKKIIKKAADQLETGNPYSAVIFKAYQKMGAHLRRYGFMRRDADTFREFEDAVRSALPIDERSLDNFLDILEEARYSKHVIGEGHKNNAIGCLRAVEKSLDNIILDEEAALRQMEIADEEYTETEIIQTPGKGG